MKIKPRAIYNPHAIKENPLNLTVEQIYYLLHKSFYALRRASLFYVDLPKSTTKTKHNLLEMKQRIFEQNFALIEEMEPYIREYERVPQNTKLK